MFKTILSHDFLVWYQNVKTEMGNRIMYKVTKGWISLRLGGQNHKTKIHSHTKKQERDESPEKNKDFV